jgi:hypothetical protein
MPGYASYLKRSVARRSGRAGRALAGLTTADYVDIEGFDISDDASVNGGGKMIQ